MCVVGKCFDTVRAAVDLMRERKGIKKVTVGELTLISRSLHKIPRGLASLYAQNLPRPLGNSDTKRTVAMK